MLSDINDIKRLWPGEAVNLDDVVPVKDDKTAYTLFIESCGNKAGRRLVSWVGEAVYEDAASGTPIDTDRADALKEAEFELIHVEIIEKLWRDKSAGVERDIQLPSGRRITLEAFSDYELIITTHVGNAYRAVLEYIP